jgi:pseudouridine-5'-phosphate glycosidase
MPYPQNVETALQVEDIIKTGGAVPATVGLINGEIVVGMLKLNYQAF